MVYVTLQLLICFFAIMMNSTGYGLWTCNGAIANIWILICCRLGITTNCNIPSWVTCCGWWGPYPHGILAKDGNCFGIWYGVLLCLKPCMRPISFNSWSSDLSISSLMNAIRSLVGLFFSVSFTTFIASIAASFSLSLAFTVCFFLTGMKSTSISGWLFLQRERL